MNIGEASQRSGLPSKTIRYYEEVGLIRPARAANGYRDYGERDVHVLRFLQRSRSLGFSIDEARNLLSLYGSGGDRQAMHRLAARKIAEIDRKIEELQTLRTAVAAVTDETGEDGDLGCPILDEIAGEGARMPGRMIGV
ncbi:MerR family transcriptional regulator [Aureimonas pseudogalii]|uniref:DNA-binding transcriptional MerR regulator n=1 Tax=Aureimonas pseudogalii TaxID=1744844 RepID=A0A7W6EGS8_9HYPH|nr:MerR family transcriptional regulator [Aureimonas pseudogalii]MBB3997709.1 DNA-binding transcriptional MerR regulator [Aureimonas pseudogalii]